MRNGNLGLLSISNCVIVLSVMVIVFGGCSYPARSIKMIPESYEVIQEHNHSIQVVVEGGQTENSSDMNVFITNEEFKKAIDISIQQSKVFSEYALSGDAEYLLEVKINNWALPEAGGALEVVMTTYWTLIDQKTKAVVWKDLIATDYTAPWDASFDGFERTRMALEGAVINNIKRGISEISRVELKN